MLLSHLPSPYILAVASKYNIMTYVILVSERIKRVFQEITLNAYTWNKQCVIEVFQGPYVAHGLQVVHIRSVLGHTNLIVLKVLLQNLLSSPQSTRHDGTKQ